MSEFLSQLPLFSLILTLGAYQIGLFCQKKWKKAIFNPLLISVALIVAVLLITGISVETYQVDMKIFSWMLTPATVALAVPLYEQMQKLKKNLPAILAGVAAGALTSLVSVFALCALFALDRQTTVSLLPKSVTTAIALGISENAGGIPGLTAAAVVITGVEGAMLAPLFAKVFHITDPVAEGVAIGSCSHAIGTSKAMEIGSLQGAMSSIAICVCGILTSILVMFF